MQQIFDDCQKPRLTERVDIQTAVNILRSRGYQNDEMISEITKLFYVDLDEYNDVIGDGHDAANPNRFPDAAR